MVSVALSELGCTQLIFVEPGVKVNDTCYRDELLSNNMLPALCQIDGEQFIFQQDNMLAHRAGEFFRRSSSQFITPDLWPPNSTDLNPVYYKIWE